MQFRFISNNPFGFKCNSVLSQSTLFGIKWNSVLSQTTLFGLKRKTFLYFPLKKQKTHFGKWVSVYLKKKKLLFNFFQKLVVRDCSFFFSRFFKDDVFQFCHRNF